MAINYNDGYLICDCCDYVAIHFNIDNRKNCLTEYKKERKEFLDEFLCNECYDEVISDYDDYDDEICDGI